MSLLLLALALSMDVFAAAPGRGVAANSGSSLRTALVVGLALGAAQGLMPLLGWSLNAALARLFRDVDHWIAFVLLLLVALHMLKEAMRAGARAAAARAQTAVRRSSSSRSQPASTRRPPAGSDCS